MRNRSRRPDGRRNFQPLVGDYTNPILKPHAAEIVKKHGELSSPAWLSDPEQPVLARRRALYALELSTMQMLQHAGPGQRSFTRPDHEVRRVRMNQSHPHR